MRRGTTAARASRTARAATAAVALGLGLVPSAAGAKDVQVVAVGFRFAHDASCPAQYWPLCSAGQGIGAKPLRVTMDEGDTLTFANVSVFHHDLRSVEVDTWGRPLFHTPVLRLPDAPTPVTVEDADGKLDAGLHPFYCTFHPPRGDGTGMLGVLDVRRTGAPL